MASSLSLEDLEESWNNLAKFDAQDEYVMTALDKLAQDFCDDVDPALLPRLEKKQLRYYEAWYAGSDGYIDCNDSAKQTQRYKQYLLSAVKHIAVEDIFDCTAQNSNVPKFKKRSLNDMTLEIFKSLLSLILKGSSRCVLLKCLFFTSKCHVLKYRRNHEMKEFIRANDIYSTLRRLVEGTDDSLRVCALDVCRKLLDHIGKDERNYMTACNLTVSCLGFIGSTNDRLANSAVEYIHRVIDVRVLHYYCYFHREVIRNYFSVIMAKTGTVLQNAVKCDKQFEKPRQKRRWHNKSIEQYALGTILELIKFDTVSAWDCSVLSILVLPLVGALPGDHRLIGLALQCLLEVVKMNEQCDLYKGKLDIERYALCKRDFIPALYEAGLVTYIIDLACSKGDRHYEIKLPALRILRQILQHNEIIKMSDDYYPNFTQIMTILKHCVSVLERIEMLAVEDWSRDYNDAPIQYLCLGIMHDVIFRCQDGKPWRYPSLSDTLSQLKVNDLIEKHYNLYKCSREVVGTFGLFSGSQSLFRAQYFRKCQLVFADFRRLSFGS